MTDLIQLLKDRLTSPFFSTYLISRLITNRNFFYTMLFVDENLIFQREKLLKNEYLTQLFYNHEFIIQYLGITSNIRIKILSINLRFIIPLIMVFIVYYIINNIEKHIYKLEKTHNKDKLRIKYEQENEGLDYKINNLQKQNEINQISLEINTIKEYKSIIPEFEGLAITHGDSLIHFGIAINHLRKYIRGVEPTNQSIYLKTEILNFFEQKGIIISNDNNIKLTEKGKVFINWYDKRNKLDQL